MKSKFKIVKDSPNITRGPSLGQKTTGPHIKSWLHYQSHCHSLYCKKVVWSTRQSFRWRTVRDGAGGKPDDLSAARLREELPGCWEESTPASPHPISWIYRFNQKPAFSCSGMRFLCCIKTRVVCDRYLALPSLMSWLLPSLVTN